MADEGSDQQPAGDGQQRSSSVGQGIMSRGSQGNSGNENSPTASLARDVHWITHATFWSQVGLGLIGLIALWIYYHQLVQMTKETRATQQAAYAACLSARISRGTLEEMRSGETDTHNLAVGSIIQADAVTRIEAAHIRIDTPDRPGQYKGTVVIVETIVNVGQSMAFNVKAHGKATIERIGEEPSFKDNFPVYNNVSFGTSFPVTRTQSGDHSWDMFITNKSGEKVSSTDRPDPDFQKWNTPSAGGFYLSIRGRVTYRDIFGVTHWTQFCAHDPAPYPVEVDFRFKKCAAYNQSDINSVPNVSHPQLPKESPTGLPEIVCVKPED